MDRIVVIYADMEQQIKRLSLRDNFTREAGPGKNHEPDAACRETRTG